MNCESVTSSFADSTINSVEPCPVSPKGRPETRAVLPFSRQGVIRANSVSPLRNLEPLPLYSRVSRAGSCLWCSSISAIATKDASVPRVKARLGFTSIASPKCTVCQSLSFTICCTIAQFVLLIRYRIRLSQVSRGPLLSVSRIPQGNLPTPPEVAGTFP